MGCTSNQDREIATTGSGHEATTGADTDMCYDPMTMDPPKPFVNYVTSDKLLQGTTRTFIGDCSIWTASGQLGPPSEEAHPPEIFGANTGYDYRQEATATTWSCDVIVEGAGVVRTADTTLQNWDNAEGTVAAGQLSGSQTTEADVLQQVCKLMALFGNNLARGQQLPGVNQYESVVRPLGYPGEPEAGKDPYYLEILGGSQVDFTSLRQDTTVDPGAMNPLCRHVHTHWVATRVDTWDPGGPAEMRQVGGEVFVVDGGFASTYFDRVMFWLPTNTTVERENDPQAPFGVYTSGSTIIDGATGGNLVTGVYYGNTFQALATAIAYILYYASPAAIDVTANACQGTMTAKLKVFPSTPINATVSLGATVFDRAQPDISTAGELNDAIYNALTKVQDIHAFVEKFANVAQKRVELRFMVGAELSLAVCFKACTETKRGPFGRLYTPSHVGIPITFGVAANPLIGFECRIPISLINIIAPGLGEGAATALRTVGIRADLEFIAGISVTLGIYGGLDEYGWPTFEGVRVSLNPTLGLAFVIGLAIDLVEIGVVFNISLSALFCPSEKPTCLLQMEPSGTIDTVFYLTVFPDLGWPFNQSWQAAPDFFKLSWLGERIDVMPVS